MVKLAEVEWAGVEMVMAAVVMGVAARAQDAWAVGMTVEGAPEVATTEVVATAVEETEVEVRAETEQAVAAMHTGWRHQQRAAHARCPRRRRCSSR